MLAKPVVFSSVFQKGTVATEEVTLVDPGQQYHKVKTIQQFIDLANSF